MPLIQPQTPQQPAENQPVGRRDRGTGFTNIQNLLKANVGAGQKMGSAIGRSLTSKAGKLSEDVSKAGSAFQDRYSQSTGEQREALEAAAGLIPSNPEGVGGLGTMTEEAAKEVGEKLAEAKTYKGPEGIEGASQLGSRAASLAGLGTLARGGGSGQGLLLQGIAGKNKPYTRGQSSLDTFLLGQSKEAQKDIKQGAAKTLGAEQQTQTITTGAEQQAKEGAYALEKQQANILKKAAESGQAIGKYGEEQASKYYADAARLQKLIQDIALPGFDPSKLQESDKALFDRMGEFGFDVDLTVDPRERFSPLSRNLLASIAGTGETVAQAGAKRLSKEQEIAFKNLALLQRQEAPTISPFDEKLFSSEEAKYSEPLNQLRDEQEQALNEKNQDLNRFIWGSLPLGAHGDRSYNPSKNYEQIYEAFRSRPYTGSGGQGFVMLPDAFARIDRLMQPYKQKISEEGLAQKGLTISDYLKSLYGINSQGSGQA